MVRVFFLLLVVTTLFSRGFYAPDNRSQAEKILTMVYLDYKTTVLEGCGYHYDVTSCLDKSIVETQTCALDEQNLTVVWMQVVLPSFYARGMVCFQEDGCVSPYTGNAYGGELCCRQKNSSYQKIQGDLYNYMPVVSSLVKARGSRMFGMVKKADFVLGKTRFNEAFIEPGQSVKGDVARVYLYMDKVYNMKLSKKQKQLFLQWHEEDKVDEKECALAKFYKKVQKRANPFVEAGCR